MRVRAFLLAAVVAGLAVLGVACGGGGEDTSPTPTAVPAQDYTELTGEQAIQRVLEMLEAVPGNRPDPSTATATSIKDCETVDVMRWEGGQWGSTPDNPSERPAWLVKIRGEFPAIMAGGLDRDTTPRSGTLIWVLKTNGLGGTIRFDERQHEGPELSSEDIIRRFLLEIEPMQDQPDLSAATATPMTEREALEALERAGGAPDLSMRVLTDDPAWLVEVRGESVDSCTLAPLEGRYLSVRHPDGSPVSSGFIPDAAATPGPAVELTQEEAIERAFELLANYLFFEPDPSTATATRTTYGDALETVQREGAPPDGASGLPADLPVWLVEVRGENVKVGAAATYVFILNIHGGSEYDGQILGATLTATASPAPSPEPTATPEAIATPLPAATATAILTAVPTPSPPPTIYDLIQRGDLVIYGGTLLDGTGVDPLPDAVVVVHEDRISALAQEPVFQPPPGTQAVNARGGTIMPGIIDSHAHITGDITGPDGLWYWLEEGVTTLRDIASVARPADLKMLVAALGDRAPRVVVAGPIVTAPGGYPIPGYGTLVGLPVIDPDDARTKIGELLDGGADIIKVALEPVGLPVMSLETAQAITQLAHERGTLVTAHATPLEGVRLAIDAGVDSLAHAPLEVPPKEMVDEMIAKGMYVVSTLDIYGGQGAKFLTPFAQAGGKVALGTDYGCCEKGYVPGGMPVKEMQLLLDAGLTPMQVIVAATKHGAEVSNLGDELGTIEPGKLADIIVVDGDPIADIDAMRNVTVVIQSGKLVVGEAAAP